MRLLLVQRTRMVTEKSDKRISNQRSSWAGRESMAAAWERRSYASATQWGEHVGVNSLFSSLKEMESVANDTAASLIR